MIRKDIYATACLAGTVVYWLILEAGGAPWAQQLFCAITIIGLRVLTLRYNLSLPILSQHAGNTPRNTK